MNRRVGGYALGAVALLVAVGYVALATGAVAPYLGVGYDPGDATDDATDDGDVHGGYEHATVTIYDAKTSETLGSVEAAVADSFRTRYVGLSETDELPYDRGMLFVHDESDEYTYVMRNMSFGIDIVFVASDGTITEIHEAAAPGPGEDGESQRYSGEGQYVLEVNRGWMADHGVEVGDRVAIER